MNKKYLIALTALLQMGISDMLEQSEVTTDLVLRNIKQAEKKLRADENYKEHIAEVIELIKLFKRLSNKLNKLNKQEALKIAKEVDNTLKEILDLSKEDEYIMLITALYLGKNMQISSIDDKLIQEKCDRLYNTVIEILSKHHSREVIRTSGKIAETIIDYIVNNKKIPYTIKRNKPSWAR